MDRPLLIVKVGSTLPAISEQRGDFEQWLVSHLGANEDDVSILDVRTEERLPNIEEVGGIIVTGSSEMVTSRKPWSVSTGEFLKRAVAAETPVLGICYGHQLLADALGGTVARNPKGREIGTVEIALTEHAASDAIFGGFSAQRIVVQATHVESVLELPACATLLGGNESDPNQAFRVGRTAWGVQFHPEFDAAIIRSYIEGRRDIIRNEGIDLDALLASTRDTDHGRMLLRSFYQLVKR